MPRLLLTGATGFIGRHAIEPLRARGFEVHAVTSGPLPKEAGEVRWHRHDLLAPGEPGRAVRAAEPELLLHLGWQVAADGVENFDWLRASLELVGAFREGGGRRALLAGSCAEYDWKAPQPLTESSPRRPATAYGVAKDALGRAFHGFCEETGLSGVWGRIFFVYGPGESPNRLVPSVLRALLAGEPARTTHGEQLRDYLYAGDLGEALAAVLASDVMGPINLASGTAVPLRTLVETAARQLDAEELVELGAIEAHPDEAPEVRGDVTRLSSELGWAPRVDLEQGIAESIAWWREQVAA